jgi:hypothetical protein
MSFVANMRLRLRDTPAQLRRVFVTYRGADAAGHAERLYDELLARLGPAVAGADDEPLRGDVVLVVVGACPRAPARPRLRELRAEELEDGVLRGDEVLTVAVGRCAGADGARRWFVNEANWDQDIEKLAARLGQALQESSVPRRPLAAALSADLLDRLLEAEMDGTIRRTRAGRSPRIDHRRSPEPAATDNIDVTVFSAQEVVPGDQFLIQVFAHLPVQARHARALAAEFDSVTKRGGFTSLSVPARAETELGFELRVPGVQVEEASQALIWRRRAQSVQFGVSVPEDARAGTRIATVIVSSNSVPVGDVKFKLVITDGARRSAPPGVAPVGDDARPFERAFASYAREDWPEVVRRVQVLRLKRLTRLRLFNDVLDIDPGERWSRRLYLEIDNCDVVLLFWSKAARDSEWVRREVQYALARRVTEFDPPEIVPVILEAPPCAPWPELEDRHFDDAIARLIVR